MDLATRKKELRALIRATRDALSPERAESASRAAQERAMALPEFREARMVACYLGVRGEVRTDRLVAACFDRDRRVCVPAFQRERGQYGLSVIEAESRVIRGAFGVPEPEKRDWVSLDDVDLVVVPGVAFDAGGGRLGHGGGHYDRLLGEPGAGSGVDVRPFMLGLAFDLQVVESVPVGTLDVRMDAVVTEHRAIRTCDVNG